MMLIYIVRDKQQLPMHQMQSMQKRQESEKKRGRVRRKNALAVRFQFCVAASATLGVITTAI